MSRGREPDSEPWGSLMGLCAPLGRKAGWLDCPGPQQEVGGEGARAWRGRVSVPQRLCICPLEHCLVPGAGDFESDARGDVTAARFEGWQAALPVRCFPAAPACGASAGPGLALLGCALLCGLRGAPPARTRLVHAWGRWAHAAFSPDVLQRKEPGPGAAGGWGLREGLLWRTCVRALEWQEWQEWRASHVETTFVVAPGANRPWGWEREAGGRRQGRDRPGKGQPCPPAARCAFSRLPTGLPWISAGSSIKPGSSGASVLAGDL